MKAEKTSYEEEKAKAMRKNDRADLAAKYYEAAAEKCSDKDSEKAVWLKEQAKDCRNGWAATQAFKNKVSA